MATRAYADSWHGFPDTNYLGDLTLGLLGMGEIARPVARVAQAFEMPVRYWDIERFPELEAEYGMEFVDWDRALRRPRTSSRSSSPSTSKPRGSSARAKSA